MPSPAWAGGVLPTLLAQTGDREGSQDPSKGSGDRDGDRDGQGPPCTPPQRTRRLPSAGLEPMPLLDEGVRSKCAHVELNRHLTQRYYTHKTSTAMHYQDNASKTRVFIY